MPISPRVLRADLYDSGLPASGSIDLESQDIFPEFREAFVTGAVVSETMYHGTISSRTRSLVLNHQATDLRSEQRARAIFEQLFSAVSALRPRSRGSNNTPNGISFPIGTL